MCNCVKCNTSVIKSFWVKKQPTHCATIYSAYDVQFNRICPRVFIICAHVNIMYFETFISHTVVLNLLCELFLILLHWVLFTFGVARHFINSFVECRTYYIFVLLIFFSFTINNQCNNCQDNFRSNYAKYFPNS